MNLNKTEEVESESGDDVYLESHIEQIKGANKLAVRGGVKKYSEDEI